MIITVSPLPDSPRWGVFAISGNYILLVGTSKNSFDADFAAEMLAKGRTDIHENPDDTHNAETIKEFLALDRSEITVEHFPEQREANLRMQEETKKAKKDARRNDS